MRKVVIGLMGLALLGGCKTVYDAERADGGELAGEASVIVVRPGRYTLIGTRSMRDYLEVVYEDFAPNEAGQPVVKIGLRNVGGKHWWDAKAPDFTLFAQVAFYENPLVGSSVRSAPLYRTNKRPVPMLRGEVVDLSFTSPVRTATGYQVTLSEN